MAKTIPFVQKGPKADSKDGKIVDHGTLDNLEYEVFERNVIHVFNDKMMFHKDITAFETEITKIDFTGMKEGDTAVVKGSGDTDNIIFRCQDDEIKIELTRKGFDALETLKSILKRNKKS
jgi:hypothetical protein